VIITTDHSVFDYNELVQKAALIMDTRNALRAFAGQHIHRL
jgi:UDP-N-acetyl-D-mannosaminuronate dehydrogenase